MITDWHFYAFAIPAVFLMGLGKSGFGAGFGALAVPLMAMTITVPQAAAILMPLLFVMDVMGLAAFRKDFDRTLFKFLLPSGLIGIVIGTFLFKYLQANVVAGIVGGVTLLFLAQRFLFPPRADASPPPRWVGRLLVTVSGFTSFVAHAGGPPYNAYMIPLKLKPIVYTATAAYFFFVINLSKWIPYAYLGLLDMRNFYTAMVLMPIAPLGVWAGIKLARNMQPTLFYRIVYIGMFCTGCKLLWDGFH